ncbi:DNA cytosine methyltransferase [Runella sp.]|uniref:DNA cytosine methyltransferase n=1 Tax=Runella sp. TaxID=1960881 RepID=UPI003D1465E4
MQPQAFSSIINHIALHPTIKLVYVDLFCGAGGTSTGVHKAKNSKGEQVAMVVACVNHDAKAIASHAANHPNALHYIEDIKTLNLTELTGLIRSIRQRFPHIKICLWASLECTNFSNAKGGGSRNADSRSLAKHMPRYIRAINPDYFQVENVREFMAWGPLRIKRKKAHKTYSELAIKYDKKTKRDEYVFIPVSRKKGEDYVRWMQGIEGMGYVYSFRIMNAADYGAFTSRSRYFAIFSKPGLQVAWPKQTHAKNPAKQTLFGELKKWNAVRSCLDLEDKGESIFGRKEPLVENTLKRIYAGLVKHVAKGDLTFLAKYYSGDDAGKCISIDGPAGTMTTTDSHGLVSADPFIMKYLGNNEKTGINNGKSIDEPSIAITTQGRQALISPEPFLMTYYSGSHENRVKSLDEPYLTVTTENRHGVVSVEQDPFIMQSNGGEPSAKSYPVSQPSRVITSSDNQSIVSPEFLVKYHGSEKEAHSLDKPCGSITTKDRAGLVSVENFLLGQASSAALKPDDEPSVTLLTDCNNRMVSVEKQWLHDYKYENEPRSLEEPAPSLLTVGQHYLVTTNHGGNTHSIENPSPVVIASQHKAPISVVSVSEGSGHWIIEKGDSEAMVKIKVFMQAFNISNIYMRMLKVSELLPIQGFPKDYILKGSDTDKKKFIGNAVEVNVAAAWTSALACA